MTYLTAHDLSKEYHSGRREPVVALADVTLSVERGSWTSITGPSGSGKSTLLSLLAVLDRPSSGRVSLEDREIGDASDVEQARLRRERFGVVFQDYHLVESLTAWENVALPLVPSELSWRGRKEIASKLLVRVGLEHRIDHRPRELSGGERQRVAAARALVGDPEIIFADEPTSNIDEKAARQLIDVFQGLRDRGRTLIVVTHDAALIEQSDLTLTLEDGRLVGDRYGTGES